MLPIYVSYFAANKQDGKNKALSNSLGFVLGFTIVFVALGAFAGTVGSLLREYSTVFNIVTGLVVIAFGLNFLGVLNIGFLNRTHRGKADTKDLGFFFLAAFWHCFFHWLDAMRWRISRLCADVSITTGWHISRHLDVAGIFRGAWHPIRRKRDTN